MQWSMFKSSSNHGPLKIHITCSSELLNQWRINMFLQLLQQIKVLTTWLCLSCTLKLFILLWRHLVVWWLWQYVESFFPPSLFKLLKKPKKLRLFSKWLMLRRTSWKVCFYRLNCVVYFCSMFASNYLFISTN